MVVRGRWGGLRQYATGAVGAVASRFKKGGSTTGTKYARGVKARRATKRKVGRSFTKTKTKRKKRSLEMHADNTGWSYSAYKYKAPVKLGPKMYQTLANPFKFTDLISFVVGSNTQTLGIQLVETIKQCWTVTDYDFLKNLYWNETQAANPILSLRPATAYQNNSKVYIESARFQFDFVNQTESNTHIALYTCVAKDSGTFTIPSSLWDTLIDNDGGSTLHRPDIGFPGDHPNQLPEFKKRWRIVNQVKILMPPGGHHTHFSTHRYNKIMNNEDFATDACQKGLTTCWMMVAYGTPADNLQAYGGVAANVQLTPVKVIGTIRSNYVMRQLPIMPAMTKAANYILGNVAAAVPNSTTPAVHLYQQNEHTGAPVDLLDDDNVA